MKHMIKGAMSLAALLWLAGCGLSGNLERPPPIFSDPPSEEAKVPVAAPVQYAVKDIRDTTYLNSLGGEIPRPSPSIDIEEDAWEDAEPG